MPSQPFSQQRVAPGQGREKKLLAASVSIGVNIFLIVLKLVVGLATGSLAVLAAAGDSLTDLVASGFAYWGVRLSTAPPDATHHYGHEKFENFSSFIQTLLLGGIAAFVVYEAVRRLLFGFSIQVTNAMILVLVLSIAVDFFIARYLREVAKTYGSAALEADAYHFASDVWSGGIIIAALAGTRLGYGWLDIVAASLVAAIMVYVSIHLATKSVGVLLDAAPEAELEQRVRQVIAAHPATAGFHSVRLRQMGSSVLLDFVLEVPASLTMAQGHDVSHQIAGIIRTAVPEVRDVVVHLEPEGHEEELDQEHA